MPGIERAKMLGIERGRAVMAMMKLGGVWSWLLRAAVPAVCLFAGTGGAIARCEIPASPCYPWQIRDGEKETVLLEIIPNNVSTGTIYRVCVCPPAPDVAIVFDFGESSRVLGTIVARPEAPICRDYRFQTARQSALKLRRPEGSTGAIEGCYLTSF